MSPQIDPRQYNTGIPEIDSIPFENKYQPRPEDLIETYGGIIKDLTETETILNAYEYKLQGKRYNPITKEVEDIVRPDDKNSKMINLSRSKAIEFVDMLRSIVNQNTHFTNFDERIINNILLSANYSINRWLMFQGEHVPLRYRPKIAFEAMNLIIASLYKSNRGTILDWTKGSFSVGEDNRNKQEDKSHFLLPWTWGKGR